MNILVAVSGCRTDIVGVGAVHRFLGLRSGPEPDILREVKLCPAAPELKGGLIVSPGSSLGSVECAQPNPRSLEGVPDFGSPFAPWPLPHSSVFSSRIVSVRADRGLMSVLICLCEA